MGKVLRKRLLRELKSNSTKYMSLICLIIMGMYIVISIVGAAETVIVRTKEYGEKNHVEDGQFRVFLPLTEEQEEAITKKEYQLEKMFSVDLSAEDGSRLRAMKVRKQLNLIELDEGSMPQKAGEAVVEKRYAKEHGLSVGDTFKASGLKIRITGIGSTPDYDAPYEQFSDTAVSSSNFGTMFVTNESTVYKGLHRVGI